jgi:hypothetical protein
MDKAHPTASKEAILKVQEKQMDKRWETSETIARQGAGVFLGGNDSDMTPLFKKGMTGKRVR